METCPTAVNIADAMTARSRWKELLRDGWGRWRSWRQQRRCAQQLAVRESVSLGEKRALVVAQFEQERFLIGITGSSMCLLTKLPNPGDVRRRLRAK